MGALSKTSGAVVIHSKGLIEDRQERWREVTIEHIKWFGGGGGGAEGLGFPSDLLQVSQFPKLGSD